MVEGARLESVFRGNSNVGSNPTLSAMTFKITGIQTLYKRCYRNTGFLLLGGMAHTRLFIREYANHESRAYAV